MCYNSIDRQIDCVSRLIDCARQVPVDASTIQYQVMESIRVLKEIGLPTDLADKYLKDYWKHIEDCHQEIEERINTRDLPFLWDLSARLDEIRRM